MKPKYFGTDGIRGKAGSKFINDEFVGYLAAGISTYLLKTTDGPKSIVIGMDTRASGPGFAKVFADHFSKYGFVVHLLGVRPTPQIAFAVTHLRANLGIAITASHNPASDNGFKLFNQEGSKFTIAQELEIETCIDNPLEVPLGENGEITDTGRGLTDAYFAHIKQVIGELDLQGMKIAVDTANGATTGHTPRLLEELGAEILLYAHKPDGSNINAGCGSEHPEALQQMVVEQNCDLGIAHDGDGDRVIFCDRTGEILSGEHIMAYVASYAGQAEKSTETNPLVTTIQSNLALDAYIRDELQAKTLRTDIGDRNVYYEMRACEATFGGENSGHYIFSRFMPTGGGLIAALNVLKAIQLSGVSLEQHRSDFTLFPSKLVNLKVAEKKPLESLTELMVAKTSIEEKFAGAGRVLLRYSGTENKLRILVECASISDLEQAVDQLVQAAQSELGVK